MDAPRNAAALARISCTSGLRSVVFMSYAFGGRTNTWLTLVSPKEHACIK